MKNEKKHQFTRTELIKAFNKWNNDYINKPDEFDNISVKSGERQADELIRLLTE